MAATCPAWPRWEGSRYLRTIADHTCPTPMLGRAVPVAWAHMATPRPRRRRRRGWRRWSLLTRGWSGRPAPTSRRHRIIMAVLTLAILTLAIPTLAILTLAILTTALLTMRSVNRLRLRADYGLQPYAASAPLPLTRCRSSARVACTRVRPTTTMCSTWSRRPACPPPPRGRGWSSWVAVAGTPSRWHPRSVTAPPRSRSVRRRHSTSARLRCGGCAALTRTARMGRGCGTDSL